MSQVRINLIDENQAISGAMQIEYGKVKDQIEELLQADYELGFPHADCKSLAKANPAAEWMIADLNTFIRLNYSFADVKRVLRRPTEELEKDKDWFSKPFFERFKGYLPIKDLISAKDTPTLFKALEINENIRRLLFELISSELLRRKKD